MIKAILYDLDGVLVDACEWHYESLNRALKEVCDYTISRKDHETIFNGLPTKIKLEILTKVGTISSYDAKLVWDLKQKYTLEVINETAKIDYLKQELHEYTKSLGIISGCVTNSIKETAALMLNKTGQLQYMSFLITNEDTIKNKPDPAPYLLGIQTLGLDPKEVLIVEDSEKGLAAAYASGANVLYVKNSSYVTINIMGEVDD